MSKGLVGRTFLLLWLSETIFTMGGALTSFALGVWVFERSNSVAQFSYVMLSSALASLMCLPFAALLADRFDRRWVIALCDCANILIIGVLAVLAFNHWLVVTHLYIFAAIASLTGTLRHPSYQAAVAQIVPTGQLIRANAMMGMSAGLVQIGTPLCAGYLMAASGLEGVIAIEVLTALGGAGALLYALRGIPHALRGDPVQVSLNLSRGIQNSFAGVLCYFKAHPLMGGLLAYVLIQESLLVLVATMVMPLVLATHNSATLGWVMTFGAIGGLTGSLILMALNVTKRLMIWVLASDAVLATFVVLAGLASTQELWSLCAFGVFASGGVSVVCSHALWMRKVPNARQGSVFASIDAGKLIATCGVLLIGGATIEQIFEPMMMPGALAAQSMGAWLGVGKGRGVALLFVLTGVTFGIASLVAMLHPRLRAIDRLIPDSGKSSPPLTVGQ